MFPKAVFILLSIIFPHASYIFTLGICINASDLIGSMTWKTISYGFPMSASSFIGLSFAHLFIAFLFAFLRILTSKPIHGLPICRFSDIFHAHTWKRIFSKKHQVVSFNDKIELQNITKVYKGENDVVALKNANLVIGKGDIVIVVGANGLGKSTMIHLLTGEFEIDSGNIFVFGQNIEKNYELLYQNLGIVFQDDLVLKDISAKEIMTFFGSFHQYTEEELQMKIEQIAHILNLDQILNTKSDELSGGQKRKLMFALALLCQPNILILDEPTSGVDTNSRHEIWKAIASMENCTILITSHALEEFEQISTKIVVMKVGGVAFSGSANDLRFQYKCGYLLSDDKQTCDQDLLLKEIQTIIPEASHHQEKKYAIIFPADFRVTTLLKYIEEIKDKINLKSYSLHLDSLEHTLLKVIQDEEVQIQ
jgi:ABC-type multidrug transport system ATPase subunit